MWRHHPDCHSMCSVTRYYTKEGVVNGVDVRDRNGQMLLSLDDEGEGLVSLSRLDEEFLIPVLRRDNVARKALLAVENEYDWTEHGQSITELINELESTKAKA